MTLLSVPARRFERTETELEAARLEISALKARICIPVDPLPEWRLSGQLTILFSVLMAHRVAKRAVLISALYPNPDDEPEDVENLLRVQIRKLRLKLGPLGIEVHNAWGQGYFFDAATRARLGRMLA